jgi:drug/metabolite transporter (DMT)-like permease
LIAKKTGGEGMGYGGMSYGRGAVMVVSAAVLWSLMGLSIRQLEVAGTWQVLFWRSLGMVPVLLAFIGWRSSGRPVAALRSVGVPGVIGGLALVAAFAGAIYAIQSTTVANAVFLFSASPFFAAILGWLILHERVRPMTWVAIGLAGLGMFLMVREGLAVGALDGNVAAVLSALGFAVFTLTLRWGRLTDMMPAVVLGGLFSMVAAAILLMVHGRPLMVPVGDIVLCVLMGALLLGLGMVLYTLGSRVIPAAELTLLSMVEVLLAPIWVWLVLGETATTATFVGGAVVLAAVALNALSGARRRATL